MGEIGCGAFVPFRDVLAFPLYDIAFGGKVGAAFNLTPCGGDAVIATEGGNFNNAERLNPEFSVLEPRFGLRSPEDDGQMMEFRL